jgi:hypothetical protein
MYEVIMTSNGNCITEHYKTGSAPRRWSTGTDEQWSVARTRKFAAAVGVKPETRDKRHETADELRSQDSEKPVRVISGDLVFL